MRLMACRVGEPSTPPGNPITTLAALPLTCFLRIQGCCRISRVVNLVSVFGLSSLVMRSCSTIPQHSVKGRAQWQTPQPCGNHAAPCSPWTLSQRHLQTGNRHAWCERRWSRGSPCDERRCHSAHRRQMASCRWPRTHTHAMSKGVISTTPAGDGYLTKMYNTTPRAQQSHAFVYSGGCFRTSGALYPDVPMVWVLNGS